MYFLEDVILPPGEKIRRIRSYLGLRQYEITGGRITRNLISYIENGKTKLVKETAEIIVESMVKRAEAKNISIDLDAEYIMRDEHIQAYMALDRGIKELRGLINKNEKTFSSKCLQINDILEDWDIVDKKADYYDIVGDYSFSNRDFENSRIYYVKALENSVKCKNNLKIVNEYQKLAKCSAKTKNYTAEIKYNEYALDLMKEHDMDDINIKRKMCFDNAVAFYKLGNYDVSLEKVDEIIESEQELTPRQKVDIYILRGDCYYKQGCCNKAKVVYMDAVKIAFDNDIMEVVPLLYINLSNLFIKMEQNDRAVDFIERSIKMGRKINNEYLVELYYSLGCIYLEENDYERAYENLLVALQEAKERKKQSVIVDIYKSIAECHIKNRNKNGIENVVKEVLKLELDTRTETATNKIKHICEKACRYFMDEDVEKAKEILSSAIAC